MSREPMGTPRDPRMRRRRSSRQQPRPQPPVPPEELEEDTTEPEAAPDQEVVSRTLFSYLEPGLDKVTYVGPALVIAGIVGLIAGGTVVAFVTSLKLYGYITIGIGVVLIGLVTLISVSSVFSGFLSRTGRYGVNSVIMLAAFIGIVAVAGFVSFENHHRMDVTATKQFSLATRTRQLLKDLDQPVRATAFYISDYRKQEDQVVRRAKVEETLREFKARTSKFSFRFVDPDLEPETARQCGLSKYESVAV